MRNEPVPKKEYEHVPGEKSFPLGNVQDLEKDKKGSFEDQTIRKAFIRKVFLILLCQLVVTLGFICFLIFHEPTKNYITDNGHVFWVAVAVMVVTIVTMACLETARRKPPMNFICFLLYTIAQALILGVSAVNYAPNEVMMAIGISAAVCFVLTLYTLVPKLEFDLCTGCFLIAMVICIASSIVFFCFPDKIWYLLFGTLAALLFSYFLMFNTQLMIGGVHRHDINPEEYIFATLNLYIDIINVFMYVLIIIRNVKK